MLSICMPFAAGWIDSPSPRKHEMALERNTGGTKIRQPDSEIITVREGGGCSRVLGIIVLIGGLILIGSTKDKILDITFLVGVLLVLFGAILARSASP